jgi:hypothetical protein
MASATVSLTDFSLADEMERLRRDFVTRPVNHYAGTPNLGGKKLKLVARDDARNVFTIPIIKVALGDVAMPFRHPEFAMNYYANRDVVLCSMFKLICFFARIRNHRVMRKCNEVIAQIEGKKQFEFTQEMNDIDARLPEFIQQAKELGVNPYLYLDETTDEDDVAQCTNDWCLQQNPAPGKASDNVFIITDLDNVDWFVLIERMFGPGRAQAAWAGGFVDKDETFVEAALREKEEEITMEVQAGDDSVVITNSTFQLTTISAKDWDPRVKFVEGMEVGAVITHYVFTRA